ncbi:uncharacterized protein GLRG_00955 [Colletotrichum graminicola M1.001]|uniref:Uncharacterized protein n=1 Tax=Colletotrichum graminicola (strain M1.001 / M2 / FGSC 10212) TaxID=645133 RepID=E3Q544_COLGM|nr:uncharacterized protein GLRG_00955 [Colletotrichum graminicola M1.001]EFQ25811.1 hypothetical protein GLRG_00955 [Colletotrichum graminicola M1.001]
MKTGILRYDNTSTAKPSTTAWAIEPVVPWTVGDPSNGQIGEQFNIDILEHMHWPLRDVDLLV